MAITLLIVDDHAGFRAAARQLLEAEGFDVVGEAEDGASGLAAVGELRPDVVLLDVQLPDMNGFEVAAKIIANDLGAAIVLVSTADGADFEPLIAESGARGFIPKDELSGARVAALIG